MSEYNKAKVKIVDVSQGMKMGSVGKKFPRPVAWFLKNCLNLEVLKEGNNTFLDLF